MSRDIRLNVIFGILLLAVLRWLWLSLLTVIYIYPYRHSAFLRCGDNILLQCMSENCRLYSGSGYYPSEQPIVARIHIAKYVSFSSTIPKDAYNLSVAGLEIISSIPYLTGRALGSLPILASQTIMTPLGQPAKKAMIRGIEHKRNVELAQIERPTSTNGSILAIDHVYFVLRYVIGIKIEACGVKDHAFEASARILISCN